jgi:hypothetical protein
MFSLVGLALAAGCSAARSDQLSAADAVFSGLDTAVVVEVLASPAARSRVQGDDPEAAKARFQNMVRNFAACRSALTIYRTWVATGVAPPFPKQPQPEIPAATAGDMDSDIARFTRAAASGDITVLRDELTNETGCGAWIPAAPGDVDGPTITDVVKRGS